MTPVLMMVVVVVQMVVMEVKGRSANSGDEGEDVGVDSGGGTI